MTTRITDLETEHVAALAPHAREWVGRALSTAPVSWRRWEAAARECYRYARVSWPDRVVRTTSPLALARALYHARIREVPGDEDRALVGVFRRVTRTWVDGLIPRLFAPSVLGRVQREVFNPVETATAAGGAVAQAVSTALHQGALINDPADVPQSAWAAARRISVRRHPQRRPVPPDWRAWTLHLSGQWESAWCAYVTFLGALHGERGNRTWRRRIETIADAQAVGWWWPHLDFVAVCDRPSVVRTESTPDGPVRLHCDDGPAIVWPDGWSLYFWHGTLVPAWVVQRPTVAAIHAESNVEVRRCGIESLGWDTYITSARLRLVDRADDPGNADCQLSLYDLPENVWGTASRVLLVTNGSPERDGTRRRYGLPVPVDVATAVRAAAWTYGLDADQYARLARRT